MKEQSDVQRLNEEMPVLDADLLVLGAGMAGFTTAARASELGLRVILIEKGETPGGSAILSGGYVWTASSLEVLRNEDPDGSKELASVLVQDFEPGLDWVRSLGVGTEERVEILGIGYGHQVNMAQYFDRCSSVIEGRGGHILLGVDTSELVESSGQIAGLLVHRGSEAALLLAPAVALCTGGFQANDEMVSRFITERTDRLLLRSNPYSTGDGISLGIDAGGALTEDAMQGFYGHLFPSPIGNLDEAHYTLLSQYHSDHGVLIDSKGYRFTDESRGDHSNTQEVLNVDGARAYLVIDERIRREEVLRAFVPGLEMDVDKLVEGASQGARYASASSIEELTEAMAKWGVPAEVAQATLLEFNSGVAGGRGHQLHPPRRGRQRPLEEPPFAAIEVMPAITFTYGGLRTDTDGRVLDGRGQAIPGLYAAGADMGGVFRQGYAGGLARGLVFGLRAAGAAASDID
jgi:succinate dehydrogenase/fumarate reductase flavoprotein subunit